MNRIETKTPQGYILLVRLVRFGNVIKRFASVDKIFLNISVPNFRIIFPCLSML